MGIIDDLRLKYLGIIAKVAIFALELHSGQAEITVHLLKLKIRNVKV